MKRALLLLTVLSLSACMSNGQETTASWGNMYTHEARVTELSSISLKPSPKVKGKSLISPGIY